MRDVRRQDECCIARAEPFEREVFGANREALRVSPENADHGHGNQHRSDGAAAMQKKAVAFTVSDFARTFPSNGSGSDHGWGSHHMIVGGNVLGGITYGAMPILAVNGPSDTGTGRWIPTTAVDQYAATLASWYGVDSTHLPIVFPNLGRFASSNLGFLPVYPG